MDISINSSKYAKQETIQNMANIIDDELGRLDTTDNTLRYCVEALQLQLIFVSELFDEKIAEQEAKLTGAQMALLGTITPSQKDEINEKLEKLGKNLESIFQNNAAQLKRNFDAQISELKKKFNIK